ncbi:hypothetical protein [Methylobacterium sp. J-092]|uniref:hypothetical protein n=1 Tax=Methylobacterium sp. J-092 TaxID=2836667 RepID=UPI001FBAFB64|nr:hypothetical protein [Methylobacterium sp. J-092]MCJ2006260.1 hypothetical protein [Methylobacterium sp. J-092]
MTEPSSHRQSIGDTSPLSHPGSVRARKGLYIRFVTRMSGDLSEAVSAAARDDGLTAGAYVRRMLLDRVGMQSPEDARSGRPVRRPDEDTAAIASAIRALGSVSTAVALRDEAAAKAALHQARMLLIPLVARRPAP